MRAGCAPGADQYAQRLQRGIRLRGFIDPFARHRWKSLSDFVHGDCLQLRSRQAIRAPTRNPHTEKEATMIAAMSDSHVGIEIRQRPPATETGSERVEAQRLARRRRPR